jgi:hypothetical protein
MGAVRQGQGEIKRLRTLSIQIILFINLCSHFSFYIKFTKFKSIRIIIASLAYIFNRSLGEYQGGQHLKGRNGCRYKPPCLLFPTRADT